MRSFAGVLVLGIVLLLPELVMYGQAGAQLTGTVQDPTGAGVGVTVTLISLDRVIRTNSGLDGSFHFADIPPAVYDVEVTARGFTKQTLSADVRSDSMKDLGDIELKVGSVPDMETCGPHFDLNYEPLHSEKARITGEIRDFYSKRRKPLANVEVTVRRSDSHEVAATTRSDRSGKFTIANIPPGRYVLRISPRGRYSMETKPFIFPRENDVVINSSALEIGQIVACQ